MSQHNRLSMSNYPKQREIIYRIKMKMQQRHGILDAYLHGIFKMGWKAGYEAGRERQRELDDRCHLDL